MAKKNDLEIAFVEFVSSGRALKREGTGIDVLPTYFVRTKWTNGLKAMRTQTMTDKPHAEKVYRFYCKLHPNAKHRRVDI